MILSLKHVYYKRQGKIILEDINWEFQPGERWAILGLNGAAVGALRGSGGLVLTSRHPFTPALFLLYPVLSPGARRERAGG